MRRLAPAIAIGIFLESEAPITPTRLIKLLFLIRHETAVASLGAFYDFMPYKYGPYSFAAHRDLYELMRDGVVMGDQPEIAEWRLAEARQAYDAAPAAVRVQVRALVDCYRHLSDRQLIDHVYKDYPAYTTLSEIVEPRPVRHVAAPAVYTLGYEGASIDRFLRALIVHGLARIVDVRHNPVSRRFGYTKATLSAMCDKIGVEYAHLPGLGVPSNERRDLSDAESYRRLLDRYDDTLAKRTGDLTRAATLVREKASALLCFEADAACCHRGRLAPRLAALTDLPVRHLEVPHA